MLVVSTRSNLAQVNQVLELLNQSHRERTYPHTLERCFRAIEHDARVARLPRFADAASWAKVVGRTIMRWKDPIDPLELLAEVSAEFNRAVGKIAQGKQHMLEPKLMDRLRRASQGVTTEPSLGKPD